MFHFLKPVHPMICNTNHLCGPCRVVKKPNRRTSIHEVDCAIAGQFDNGHVEFFSGSEVAAYQSSSNELLQSTHCTSLARAGLAIGKIELQYRRLERRGPGRLRDLHISSP